MAGPLSTRKSRMVPSAPISACSSTEPCTFICRPSKGYDGSGAEALAKVTRPAANVAGLRVAAVEPVPYLESGAISTFSGLLARRTVLCVSPATTSTSSGGITLRLIATTGAGRPAIADSTERLATGLCFVTLAAGEGGACATLLGTHSGDASSATDVSPSE